MTIKEIIVVEGSHDKSAVLAAVDATVLETRGFGLFKDKELKALLRRLAEERGVIVLTDSDGAGFVIRSHLKGILPSGKVKHAYIREDKRGVEDMPPEVIIKALKCATIEDKPKSSVSKADFYEWGLSGSADSATKRKALQKAMGLPERLTANGLLEICNLLYAKEEIIKFIEEM